ncbi:tripartite motif-containing protein 60 isoform X2 [Macaca fascicularis]|uniref:tripartite motif-containing protein 60 isoform X2 n=1 Tax=Macaca fascicularis TaxID=9541 RepID=UPI003D159878
MLRPFPPTSGGAANHRAGQLCARNSKTKSPRVVWGFGSASRGLPRVLHGIRPEPPVQLLQVISLPHHWIRWYSLHYKGMTAYYNLWLVY